MKITSLLTPVIMTVVLAITIILTGNWLLHTHQDEYHRRTQHLTTAQADTTADNASQSNSDDTSLSLQVAQLQQTLTQIEARLTQLEAQQADMGDDDNRAQFSTVVDTPVSARARVLTTDILSRAGIDETTAADIIRRSNELELKKLELRDRAVRESFLGTPRYMQELQTLLEADIPLREELGDAAYDRYLFASGQANRIRVASVMLGSAAEQAGMQTGDLIISYDQQRLFEWNELQDATTEGSREEYVSVTVNREGAEISMWVPRGPLGVRLSSTRVNPDR